MNENEINPVAKGKEKPLNEAEQEKPKLTGVDAMRDAVEEVFLLKAKSIVEALVQSCLKGHVMAGRLLYLFGVGKGNATTEQVQKAACLADYWEDQEEWTPKACEQKAETNAGSREPE
ncbi:MAG TPA: hypothetical protein VK716_14210 [Terracidiphilus sp.]|jgi:hypothetical protein|nr:hypothetical protein [Terracidiphilus sp.]